MRSTPIGVIEAVRAPGSGMWDDDIGSVSSSVRRAQRGALL
jgi:hypothetical protein